jgi:D-inositol-3-phosphate glycosyltransferase
MNVYVRELARELSRCGIGVDIFTRRVDSGLPDVDTSLGEHARVIHVTCGSPQYLDPLDVYPHLSQFTAGVIAFATRRALTYDVVYSHYWLSGWVAQKLKEVWNAPIVHMFHTLGHMKHRIGAGKALLPDVRIATETQIVGWASRIIAATPAEHAQLLWLYRADRRKIVVIPPGVDVDRFQPIPQEEAKQRLGITRDLLLFVGRIEPLKAVDLIVEAIDLIRREQKHLAEQLRFMVIGGNLANPSEPELSRLRKLVATLGLDDLVEFLGAQDQEHLPLYYAAASAVIIPSDYESFGMVALEAMASGTPVIASEVGGLAFLVRDKETGFLVPSRDVVALAEGIATILSEPEKRELLGRNAVALAQQYAWPKIVDQLVAVFDDVSNKCCTNRHKR